MRFSYVLPGMHRDAVSKLDQAFARSDEGGEKEDDDGEENGGRVARK